MYIQTAWAHSLINSPKLICIMKCILGAELINIIYTRKKK